MVDSPDEVIGRVLLAVGAGARIRRQGRCSRRNTRRPPTELEKVEPKPSEPQGGQGPEGGAEERAAKAMGAVRTRRARARPPREMAGPLEDDQASPEPRLKAARQARPRLADASRSTTCSSKRPRASPSARETAGRTRPRRRLQLRQKSTKPSSNWGMGIQRQHRRRQDRSWLEPGSKTPIKGQAGEGPSETETTHSPEGRQAAKAAVPRDVPEVPPR